MLPLHLHRRSRAPRALVAAAAGLALAGAVLPGVGLAADVTWTNAAANFLWDTLSPNWSIGAWNNAAGDGAVFDAAGVGELTLPGAINVDSLTFAVDGYKLSGTGLLTFVSGFSSATTGVASVAFGVNAQINTPIVSAVGFQKIGPGTLEIAGAGNYTGGISVTNNGIVRADVLVGGTSGTINGGTLRVNNPSALPPSTRVSIGTGYLDIGSNKVTIGQLTFTNQNPSVAWNTTLNANNGVIGSGTLHVNGDIQVLGVAANSGGNAIASNVDLGGGEQVVRNGVINLIGLHTSLMFTGPIHNGSLVKTVGFTSGGTFGSVDGIGLYANNTYTGPTVLNSGSSIAAGNNASTAIKVVGLPAGPAGSSFTLIGPNAAFPAATTIQAVAGASFIVDNNGSLGATGLIQPTVAPGQNNNRLNDAAVIELRDGNFVYRGQSGSAASETFGSLRASGGHNTVTVTPNGGGSVVLTGAGSLSLGSRATLFVNATGTGNTLGGNARVFFTGSVPTPDPTGILPRVTGSGDFLTYSPSTGLTPFTGYATDFSAPNANVSLTAASTAPTQTINALRRSGAFTTTIGAGDTLSITSGMILNATGAGTITGGTIAFGSAPGVLFASGATFIDSAITGSGGLIHANGTGTLAGNLSGLSGELSVHAATTNLNTDTFTGPITVRSGTLQLRVSQTGAGLGPITLGVPENDADLIGTVPTLNFSAAPADSVFDRDLIVDNATETAKGVPLSFSTLPRLSPLSNLTGSQRWNGNVELRSSVNLQGGGGGGTGATVFNGAVTGAGRFVIPNGRVVFSETSSVSNAGGFLLGNTGFTVQVTFAGTGSGNGPITITSGNSNILRYASGALPGGPITVVPVSAGAPPTFIPTNSSVINNAVNLGSNVVVDVPTGVTAEWAGAVAGSGGLSKSGPGTLVLSGADSTYSGLVTINAGLLRVDATLPGASVSAPFGTLGGNGAVGGPVTVDAAGAVAPGDSVGRLGTGDVTLVGTYLAEIDLAAGGGFASADLLAVDGAVNLLGGTLQLSTLSVPTTPYAAQTFLILANDGLDLVNGTFANVTGVAAGFTFSIDYAFSGVDVLGRVGSGNDVAITLIPEPSAVAGLAAGCLALLRRRRAARRRSV